MAILVPGIALATEEKPVPVSYDLKVTIEPGQGTVAVHGKIVVPVEAGATTLPSLEPTILLDSLGETP